MKRIIKKLIPSYRVEEKLAGNLELLSWKIDQVNNKIENLDEKNEYLFWLLSQKQNETIEETKKRVFLNLPKATGSLRKIQLAENKILQRVKDICDANDIHFWLGYGTLIGAVRHQGFIPWDDDIDICMMKADCDKLFSIIKNDVELEISKCFLNNASYLTKVKYRGVESIFIDIFTFDFADCSSNEDATSKFEETLQVTKACQKFNEKLMDDLGCDWRVKDRPRNCDIAVEQIDRNYQKEICKLNYYGKGEYIGKSIYMSDEFRPTEKFLPVNMYFPLNYNSIEFEGKLYDAPSQPLMVLEHQYGDIWKFPKVVCGHHSNELVGYEEITDNY